MFRVDAESVREYFDFDAERKPDLQSLDRLIRKSAPGLARHFHRGTPAGEPGMRFKMIGYGKFQYSAGSGKLVDWPVVGVALQKNYISVYLSVTKDGVPLMRGSAGSLGAVRVGRNNFSFITFDDLKAQALAALFAEADQIFNAASRPRRHARAAREPAATAPREPAARR